jgi:acetyl esterase/lipase
MKNLAKSAFRWLVLGALPLVVSAADLAPIPGVIVRSDIAYLEPGRSERLDLYVPSERASDPRTPAVVWIHGGGWTGGSKSASRERNICQTLAAAGFVCISVDYKLGDGAWPQNLLDCKNGVRYLRAHAAELGIDPDRIAVAGGSAGGHLALMVAYTADNRDMEPDAPYSGISSAVRCVANFYGITDLLTRRETTPDGKLTDRRKPGGPLAVFGVESSDAAVVRLASPVAHVTAKSPPTLILHGRADTTVDHGQAIELARVLQEHGVPHELVLLDGVGHTFDFNGWKHRPLPRDMRPVVVDFLTKHAGPR